MADQQLDTLARFDRTLTPAIFDQAARAADDETLIGLWQYAKTVYHASWVAMSICAGIALERSAKTGGTLTMAQLGKAFEVDKSEISRAAKVYRHIVKPRIEAHGVNAAFPIWARTFYELAADAAENTGLSALDLIKEVEDRKANNGGKYTSLDFREDLIQRRLLPDRDHAVARSAQTHARAFARALSTYAEFGPHELEALVRYMSDEPGNWMQKLAVLEGVVQHLYARLEQQQASNVANSTTLEELQRQLGG
jgi:hypothetical protein